MIEEVRRVLYAYDDLGHIFEATLMLVALLPLLAWAWFKISRRAFALYPIIVFAWYHGREKAQFELALKEELGLRSVIPLWHRGWWPGEWGVDGILDLMVPSLYAVVWAFILSGMFAQVFKRSQRPRP
jgi:hypothetical protein